MTATKIKDMKFWEIAKKPIQSQEEFEALPKHEQNYRWALFLKSNGYEKILDPVTIQVLYHKHYIQKEPLKI